MFQRLNELFATTGQVGYLATQRVDGKLILPEAITSVANGRRRGRIMDTLLEKVKANLIITHDADDAIITQFITAATSYARNLPKCTRRLICGK